MERIGRYEIVRELGRGTMAIVYEGFDGRIDRHLAIKLLRNQFARDVGARQRFLREARAAGGLAHPNIVTVFDVGQSEGTPYLVMELLSAGTLDAFITTERIETLSIERILDLVGQLARALDYAHRNGVIHRDIKPANIHYDHQAGLAKVMDFGIAAIDRDNSGAVYRQGIAGTPSHIAPELLKEQPATERSDLYSLGVVLYQLLAGRLPFDATNSEALLQQVARHETLPLQPLRADTPRELVDLAYRLMAREPESRPLSARQVAEEVEEITEGRRSGIVHSMRRNSRAWRWPAAVAASVAIILVFGLNAIYERQNQAMAEVTYGFGDGLASLIAQETAEALILEDTTALSVLVSDFAVNPEVEYLHVIDDRGIVQASTNSYLLGEPPPSPAASPVARPESGVRLYRDAAGLLEFAAPIRFQARRVGEIRLGLDGSGLSASATTTFWMLLIVALAVLIAVLAGVAWLTRRHQIGLRRLAWGLKRLQRGQFDFRFEDGSDQEFAGTLREFNRLAARLNELQRRGTATSAGDSARSSETPDVSGPSDATLDLDQPRPDDVPAKRKVTPLRRG